MYRGGSWLRRYATQTIIPYLINYERNSYVSPFASAAPSSGATRADCSLSETTVPRRASAWLASRRLDLLHALLQPVEAEDFPL